MGMAPTTKKSSAKSKVVCIYDEDGDLIEEQDVKTSRTAKSDKKQKECKSKQPPPKKEPKDKNEDDDEKDVVFVAENVYEDEDGNLVMEGRMADNIISKEEVIDAEASASNSIGLHGVVVAAAAAAAAASAFGSALLL